MILMMVHKAQIQAKKGNAIKNWKHKFKKGLLISQKNKTSLITKKGYCAIGSVLLGVYCRTIIWLYWYTKTTKFISLIFQQDTNYHITQMTCNKRVVLKINYQCSPCVGIFCQLLCLLPKLDTSCIQWYIFLQSVSSPLLSSKYYCQLKILDAFLCLMTGIKDTYNFPFWSFNISCAEHV